MANTFPVQNPEDADITTPPDETRHGAVPNFQPNPVQPDPGRSPAVNPRKPGDNPDVPPAPSAFPDESELPDTSHPQSQ